MELVETQPASRRWIYVINVLLVVGCCLTWTWFWAKQRSRSENVSNQYFGQRLGDRLKHDAWIDFYKRDGSGVDQLMFPTIRKQGMFDEAKMLEVQKYSFFAMLMHSAVKATSHHGWVPSGRAEVTGANGASLTVLLYTKPSGTAGYQLGDDWYEMLGY